MTQTLFGMCLTHPVQMECCWLGLCVDCWEAYDLSNNDLVSSVYYGHYFTAMALLGITLFNLVLFFVEMCQKTCEQNSNQKKQKKKDKQSTWVQVSSIPWFRLNHIFYPFITIFFALFRLNYHLGRPLVAGAALHNLCEWVMVVYAYNKTPQSRYKYFLFSLVFIWFVIVSIAGIPKFPYFVLIEQLSGIILDFLLPMTWLQLAIKNGDNKQFQAMFYFAFFAHFFHLFGTIIPLVIENFIVGQSHFISMIFETAIFISAPVTHSLYTIFTTMYQKHVIVDVNFKDRFVAKHFKFWFLLSFLCGFVTTTLLPAIMPECGVDYDVNINNSNLLDVRSNNTVFDGDFSLEQVSNDTADIHDDITECVHDHDISDSDNIIAGRAIAKVRFGLESEFEEFVVDKMNLIDTARNFKNGEYNIFYYLFKDNFGAYIDEKTNERYTKYEFVESWKNKSALFEWIQDYPQIVFGNDKMKSLLIGQTLEYPAKLGYTLLGTQNKMTEVIEDTSDGIIKVCNADHDIEADTSAQNAFDVTPSWVYGRSAVGTRISMSNNITLDNGIVHRKTERLPLPCSVIWRAFDNFLEFQGINPKHPNTSHYSGPHNKIGEIIHFIAVGEFANLEVFEELTIKDDLNYIWQIKIPSHISNKLFGEYFFTAQLYNDTIDLAVQDVNISNSRACLVLMDMEYEFNDEISVSNRRHLIRGAQANLEIYSKWMYDVTLNKIGASVSASCVIEVDIDWLWQYLSDWTNLKWVLNAEPESLEMLQSDVRMFKTKGNNSIEIIERLSKKDDLNHILEYQILNANVMNLYTFQDRLELTKISFNQTRVRAKMMFVPTNELMSDLMKGYYQTVLNEAIKQWPRLMVDEYSQS